MHRVHRVLLQILGTLLMQVKEIPRLDYGFVRGLIHGSTRTRPAWRFVDPSWVRTHDEAVPFSISTESSASFCCIEAAKAHTSLSLGTG
jgi:hypothetical protein